MAATLGNAMVVVQVDNSRLKTGLDNARRDTQKATSHMQRDFDKTTGSVAELGKRLVQMAAAYLTFRALTNGVTAFTIAANNATETQNKFEVAFRTARGEAEKSLQAFSKLSGGLNIFALKEYAANFQLLFNAMELSQDKSAQMSTTLAKLSYDLASLYNTPIEEAFTRLQSGLVGETEAVRRFGVDVSEAALRQELLRQGIDKNFESLSQSEKVLLRYGMIMRQTSDAQGDLARTQNTGANVLRRFLETFNTIKQDLGYGFTKVIEMVGPKLLSVLNKIDFKKVAANVAATFYQMYQRIKPFIGFMVSGFNHLVNALRAAAPLASKLFNVIEAIKWGAVISALGAVLHILGATVNILNNVANAFINTTKAIAEGAKSILRAVGGQNNVAYTWMDNLSNSMDALKKSFSFDDVKGLPDWINDISKGTREVSPLADKLKEFTPDNSALREQAAQLWELVKARKEDMKAEMERRQAAIGFISGRDIWEKAAVTGERQRFAAEPAKMMYGTYGANGTFFGGQDVSNIELVKGIMRDEKNKQNYEKTMVDQLAAILATLQGQAVNQVEMGYGN
jgi:hypothetical protein